MPLYSTQSRLNATYADILGRAIPCTGLAVFADVKEITESVAAFRASVEPPRAGEMSVSRRAGRTALELGEKHYCCGCRWWHAAHCRALRSRAETLRTRLHSIDPEMRPCWTDTTGEGVVVIKLLMLQLRRTMFHAAVIDVVAGERSEHTSNGTAELRVVGGESQMVAHVRRKVRCHRMRFRTGSTQSTVRAMRLIVVAMATSIRW